MLSLEHLSGVLSDILSYRTLEILAMVVGLSRETLPTGEMGFNQHGILTGISHLLRMAE